MTDGDATILSLEFDDKTVASPLSSDYIKLIKAVIDMNEKPVVTMMPLDKISVRSPIFSA